MEIAALILGLIGLLAWFIPLIGFPITITGLIFGIAGRKRKRKGAALAGMILSAICLAATIINSVIGAYHAATGAYSLP